MSATGSFTGSPILGSPPGQPGHRPGTPLTLSRARLLFLLLTSHSTRLGGSVGVELGLQSTLPCTPAPTPPRPTLPSGSSASRGPSSRPRTKAVRRTPRMWHLVRVRDRVAAGTTDGLCTCKQSRDLVRHSRLNQTRHKIRGKVGQTPALSYSIETDFDGGSRE